jgi:hypothetical protein
MTQMLRIRIPPANTERRSNGAIQRIWPARFVLEAATRPMERKALRGLIIRLPSSNPAHARAGFLLFRGRDSVIGEQFCRLIERVQYSWAPLPLKGVKSGRSHCTLHVTAALAGREAGNHGHKKIATA